MNLYSYHIFYFPFRWSLPADANKPFSMQANLDHIPVNSFSMWERIQLDKQNPCPPRTEQDLEEAKEMFGEQQYYFDFVHPVLYDMKGAVCPLIHHYERREPKSKEVFYLIQVKDKAYQLKVESMNLNLYSTGVGILSFYLANEHESQKNEAAIRDINQFGRRIMPPHSGEFNPNKRNMLATSIAIQGLEGELSLYTDDFDYQEQATGNNRGLSTVWEPARFIQNLIKDLSPELEVIPAIDDRMLVNCWYGNDQLSEQVRNEDEDEKSSFVKGDFWYKYVFVDDGKEDTCQNDSMKEHLLKTSTYFRWQKYGTLYGVSRYSFVALTSQGFTLAAMHMRTIYSRMFELVIIQRASMLRFSSEVTKVSDLTGASHKEVAIRIGSLYKEYIRFVNQIYFRNVTVQDQGIELYNMLMEQFASNEQIKDLDEEIGELYQYITLLVDQKRNENGEKLNLLAAAFLPATLLAGFLGMNRYCDLEAQSDFWMHIGGILIISAIAYYFIKRWRK